MTSYHVVADCKEIRVYLADMRKRRRQASIIITKRLLQTKWKGLKKFHVMAVENLCSPWKKLNCLEDMNVVKSILLKLHVKQDQGIKKDARGNFC